MASNEELPEESADLPTDLQTDPEDENTSSDTEEVETEIDGDEIEQLKAELENAKSKADENWDRVLRVQAEMNNTRKRLTQEVDNARKFGQKNLIEELLPVFDSMEIGLQTANAEDAQLEQIREGYELTSKMLKQMLEKLSVEEVNPVGEKFDPDLHQAMSMLEGTDQTANTVVSVMQKGYTLNDRLVRPALVVVAK